MYEKYNYHCFWRVKILYLLNPNIVKWHISIGGEA